MFAKDKNKYPDGTAGILLLYRAERERDTACPEGDVTWTINTKRGLKSNLQRISPLQRQEKENLQQQNLIQNLKPNSRYLQSDVMRSPAL